jgi:hypothetical protein
MLPLRLTESEWIEFVQAADWMGISVAELLRDGARLLIQKREKDGSSTRREKDDSLYTSTGLRIKSHPHQKRDSVQNPIPHTGGGRENKAQERNALRLDREKGRKSRFKRATARSKKPKPDSS